jgi:hypothetical protein
VEERAAVSRADWSINESVASDVLALLDAAFRKVGTRNVDVKGCMDHAEAVLADADGWGLTEYANDESAIEVARAVVHCMASGIEDGLDGPPRAKETKAESARRRTGNSMITVWMEAVENALLGAGVVA